MSTYLAKAGDWRAVLDGRAAQHTLRSRRSTVFVRLARPMSCSDLSELQEITESTGAADAAAAAEAAAAAAGDDGSVSGSVSGCSERDLTRLWRQHSRSSGSMCAGEPRSSSSGGGGGGGGGGPWLPPTPSLHRTVSCWPAAAGASGGGGLAALVGCRSTGAQATRPAMLGPPA
jgi:hypothetical protein